MQLKSDNSSSIGNNNIEKANEDRNIHNVISSPARSRPLQPGNIGSIPLKLTGVEEKRHREEQEKILKQQQQQDQQLKLLLKEEQESL
jgi:hypothetical protein